MSISLVEVAGANFRTDEQSDELNSTFMNRLGMRKRYLPARLAISKSLAVPSQPAALPEGCDLGKVIKGDALFGTGTSLSVWLSLIIEQSQQNQIDRKKLVALVGAHWKRGLEILDSEWNQSNEDLAKFVERLVKSSGLSTSDGYPYRPGRTDNDEGFTENQIDVPIGEVSEEVGTNERISWGINGAGGSPHCAIMGGVGSGKTRTAVAMLRAIQEDAAVPLLAFDFKGDLGTDATGGGYHLEEVFGATVLEPPRTSVPLDVLTLSTTDEIDREHAASRFRDSFSRLKGGKLGDRQRTALVTATSQALAAHSPCELHHIRDALVETYDMEDMKHDGAISTITELCRFPLFTPDYDPKTFFQQSWIIKLPPSTLEDSQVIVVNLVLDALNQYLNSLTDSKINEDGSRSLRILCMVDEAHRILGTKLPALSNLVRMSRSKGGAIMLISQSPDDFSGVEDEFLAEMGLVVAFSTNAPPRHASRILGKTAKLTSLNTGQCFLKRRGDQVSKKIISW